MSHSQFHRTNLFILRHAWLNLWDKHMTTGRINQVTTFRSAFAAVVYSRATIRSLSRLGVHLSHCQRPIVAQGCLCTSLLESTSVITSFPILARLSWDPLVQGQGSPTFFEDYQWPVTPERHTQSRRIPEWLTASGLTIGKESTLLHHRSSASTWVITGKRGTRTPQLPRPIHFELGSLRNRTHQLNVGRPSQPLKRPTREASKHRSLKPPFNPLKPTSEKGAY